jgi:uncharacterized protein YxjI
MLAVIWKRLMAGRDDLGEGPGTLMNQQAPAGWYPDSFGRHEHRYWDGFQWTHHVASRGLQGVDPPPNTSPVQQFPADSRTNKQVQRQVQTVGIPNVGQDRAGEGALFTEPVLVVNQKGTVLEVNAEYDIYDQQGRQIGAVREVGQSLMKKAAAPSNRTRRLHVLDANGRVALALTQPTVWLNAKMVVLGADGRQVGQIAQKLTLHHARFRLESDGRTLGSIYGENQKRSDFSIQDAAENEIGRITRTSAGLAKKMFTKADHYVVEIHRPLEKSLRSLVIAAALAIDTALRQ